MKSVPALAWLLWLGLPVDVTAFTTTNFGQHQQRPAFSSDRWQPLQGVGQDGQEEHVVVSVNHHHHQQHKDPLDYFGDLWNGFQNNMKKTTSTSASTTAGSEAADPVTTRMQNPPAPTPSTVTSSPLEQLGDFFHNLHKQPPPEFKLPDWNAGKTQWPLDPIGELFHFKGFQQHENPPQEAVKIPAAPPLQEITQEEVTGGEGEESWKDKEFLVIRGGKVHSTKHKGRAAYNVEALNNLDIRTMLSPSVLDTSFLRTNKKIKQLDEDPHASLQQEELKKNFGLRARFWGVQHQEQDQLQHSSSNGRIGQEIFHHRGKRSSRSSRRMAFMSSSDMGGDTMVVGGGGQDDTGRDVTVTIPKDVTGPGIIKEAGKTLNGSAIDGFPKKQKASRYNIDDMEVTPFYTAYGRFPRPVTDPSSKRASSSPPPEPSLYGDVRNGWFWSTKKKQEQRPADMDMEQNVDEVTSSSIADHSSEEPVKVEIASITMNKETTTTTSSNVTTATMLAQSGEYKEELLADTGRRHSWSTPAPFTTGTMIGVDAPPLAEFPVNVSSEAVLAIDTNHAVSNQVGEETRKVARPTTDNSFNPWNFFRQKSAKMERRDAALTERSSNAEVPGSLTTGLGLVRRPPNSTLSDYPSLAGRSVHARTMASDSNKVQLGQNINLSDLNDVRHLKAKKDLSGRGKSYAATSVTQFRSFNRPSYPRTMSKVAPTKTAIPKPSALDNAIVGHSNSNNKSFLDEIRRGKELLKADYQLLHPSTVRPKDFNPRHFYQRANTHQRESEPQLRRKSHAPHPHAAVPFMESLRSFTATPNKASDTVSTAVADSTAPIGRHDVSSSSVSYDHATSVLRALSMRSASSPKNHGVAVDRSQTPPSFRPSTQLISSQRLKEQQRLHAEEVARAKAERAVQIALEKATLEEEKAHALETSRRRNAPLKLLMKWMRKPSNDEIDG